MQSVSQVLLLCQPLLDELTNNIASYLQAGDDCPRMWSPRSEPDGAPRWTADEVAELAELRIPALPTPERAPYDPDLVLYRIGDLESLDNTFSSRLAGVMNSDSHSLLVNASGTGKTRLVLEVLSRSWGFYFTCRASRVTDPYGSRDMGTALVDLPNFGVDGHSLHQPLILRGPGSRASKEHLRHNRLIARTLVYKVILARLLVFNHVCATAAKLGIPDELLRRRWFFLQLRPFQLLKDDIFGTLSKQLDRFPLEVLASETRTAFSVYGDRLQFIALDEAQAAVSQSKAFALADGRTSAPVLREIVHGLASVFQRQRILVAGTHADLRVVADAVSDVPSAFTTFRHVYSLGSIDTVERTTAYLRHFFGETFTDADCAEVHSLFQGRHRLLTVFVANVLNEGYREMDIVMNSLQQLLTGYSRPGSDHIRLPYALLIDDTRLDACWVAHQARQATFRFALTREPSTFVDDAAVFIALGIGLFCEPGPSAIICEPLVFYRLVGWLLKSSYLDIAGLIRYRLRVQTAPMHSMDVAVGFASYLLAMFSGSGRALNDGLAFQGPAVPFWSSRRARLVLPPALTSESAAADQPSKHIVDVACESVDVFRWLRTGRSPFLLPDAEFGASLLFCLHVEDIGVLLVVLFTDPFDSERPRRVATVSPKDESSFYANSPEDQQTLVSILHAAPPLPFDQGAKRQPQLLRLNVLRLLCFSRAAERPKPYNPPVAALDMDVLLRLEHAPELSFTTLDDIVWGVCT